MTEILLSIFSFFPFEEVSVDTSSFTVVFSVACFVFFTKYSERDGREQPLKSDDTVSGVKNAIIKRFTKFDFLKVLYSKVSIIYPSSLR